MSSSSHYLAWSDQQGAAAEDDVWRHFKKILETKQLLHYFEPRTIAVQDDEVEFEHTLKNGVLHCLEPVSFDLSSADSIKDKAHRWLGRITSIQNAEEQFRLYLLVGQPRDENLRAAFDSALSILHKMPVKTDIFSEEQGEELSERLLREVAEHMSSANH